MISPYVELVNRIHQELDDLETVVTRAERGMQAAQQRPEDQDLYIDSAAQLAGIMVFDYAPRPFTPAEGEAVHRDQQPAVRANGRHCFAAQVSGCLGGIGRQIEPLLNAGRLNAQRQGVGGDKAAAGQFA